MKPLTTKILLGLALAIAGAQAQAISLSPSTFPQFSGSDPNNPKADDVETIVGTDVELVEAYKDDQDDGESGSFADVYTSTYGTVEEPLSAATITFTGTEGEQIACPECFLLVKDGNQNPIWYIFDLGDWDGMEVIELTDFWVGNGEISHITIFSDGKAVPGPAPFVLMGIGLLGMALGRFVKTS